MELIITLIFGTLLIGIICLFVYNNALHANEVAALKKQSTAQNKLIEGYKELEQAREKQVAALEKYNANLQKALLIWEQVAIAYKEEWQKAMNGTQDFKPKDEPKTENPDWRAEWRKKFHNNWN